MYVRYVLVQYAAVCHYRLYRAHEPPEDGRIYRPKHVGASFVKVF